MRFECYSAKTDDLQVQKVQSYLVRFGNFSGATSAQIRVAGDLIQILDKENQKRKGLELVDFNSIELWISSNDTRDILLRVGIKPQDDPYWKPYYYSYLIGRDGTIKNSKAPEEIEPGQDPDEFLPSLKWI